MYLYTASVDHQLREHWHNIFKELHYKISSMIDSSSKVNQIPKQQHYIFDIQKCLYPQQHRLVITHICMEREEDMWVTMFYAWKVDNSNFQANNELTHLRLAFVGREKALWPLFMLGAVGASFTLWYMKR